MAKFNAAKAAKSINRMKIKGVSAKSVNVRSFTTKQKAAIAKARKELNSGKRK